MNAKVLLGAVFLVALGAKAGMVDAYGTGFVAPQIDGKGYAAAVKGEILYDNTDNNFWGKNATGWTLLGGGSGTGALSTTTKATDYAVTTDDNVVFGDANLGNITLTLPLASGRTGQQLTLKKIDASSYNVTVSPQVGENIDGLNRVVLSSRYQTITIVSNGTSWSLLSFDAAEEVKGGTPSYSTVSGSGIWHTLSGNSVVLTAGTWELGGICFLSNDGTNPFYYTTSNCLLSGLNGNNTNTNSWMSVIPGLTIISGPSSIDMTNNAGLGSSLNIPAVKSIVRCDNSCQVYLNAYTSSNDYTKVRISTSISARRVR